MAKTNSRVKSKGITFTPPSTGKSTFKPLTSGNTKTTTNSTKPASTGSKSMGQIVKGQGYKAPVKTTKPANKPVVKAPAKPVATTTTPRTRGGVSKGNTPGVGSKYTNKPAAKPVTSGTSSNKPVTKRVTAVERSGKAAPGTTAKYAKIKGNTGPRYRGSDTAALKAAKIAKAAKLAKLKNVGKKTGVIAAGVAAASYGVKKLYDYATGADDKSKKDTKKPVKKDTKKDTVKPPTSKKGDLKYVMDPKKPDAKKPTPEKKTGSLPKAIDKAVKAADGNQPGDGSSLKFTGDRSKVAGKDKWGRSPSDKWYGFNPDSNKYETPTMVKPDTKKADTKPPVKKPVTPKATTPAVKKVEPVGKLETKPAQQIPNKTVDEARTIIPSKTTTATPTTTTSSTSTTSSNVTSSQPRATIINKIRGAVNTGRERRAEKASARGNEAKAERLKDKISDTEKKMMMKKGGAVKSKSKKK
jgi:hypothetical protein